MYFNDTFTIAASFYIFIEIFEFLSKKSYFRPKVLIWKCNSFSTPAQ